MKCAETMEHTKSECNCFVRHVDNPLDRAEVAQQLEYFRSIGDRQGTMFAMMQLSACPSQTTSANLKELSVQ